MSTSPEARVELLITLSSHTVSLSQLDAPIEININAKCIFSSNPTSNIIFNAQGTALDNSEWMGGSAFYYGCIKLRSVSDPTKIIGLAPAVKVSYSRDEEPDLRRNKFECFLVIPAVGRGELAVSHKLTGQRLFQYSRNIQPSNITPGEEYEFDLPKSQFPPRWWTFENGAEGKKFFEGILADENGFGGLRDDDPSEVEKRYNEGWLYSYPLKRLDFNINEESSTVIKFVE